MRKIILQLKVKVPLFILREGKRFVAYTPALDLSTSGRDYKQAKERFNEIVNIFFQELIKKGTLEEVLRDLGWTRARAKWCPPVIISQESETVEVPLR